MPFPSAAQPDIIRARQKDDVYVQVRESVGEERQPSNDRLARGGFHDVLQRPLYVAPLHFCSCRCCRSCTRGVLIRV